MSTHASPHQVLVVDDDPDMLERLAGIVAAGRYQVATADTLGEALEVLRSRPVDCVVSDVKMPDADGFALLDAVRRERPGVPVLLLTAFGQLDDAVRAVHLGADGYLSKPVRGEELREAVRMAIERAAAARKPPSTVAKPALARSAIVGRSAAIVGLYGTIARAAASRAPVLVRGETGVGKEWVARAIHRYSPRAQGPFVTVNCSALADGTLESELFGHARGSFTGAVGPRKGLFQIAHGGVLFLDEVGDLPPRVQAELLRVLQEGEVRPVGSDQPVTVDVRVVSATHRDLDQLVSEGRFREDLLFRLRVIEIFVPPLRDRREDIPLLAEHFLSHAFPHKRLSSEALTELSRRDWPGNVRELQAAVSRAGALSSGAVILVGDLLHPGGSSAASPPPLPRDLEPFWPHLLAQRVPSLDEVEQSFVRAVVAHFGGNKTQAAEALGVDRKTIRRILGRGSEPEE